MKTPEEIKTGLECCIVGECNSKQRTCPYRKEDECTMEIARDALAYIQQLEMLAKPNEQIRWERDVAIDQLKQLGIGFGEKVDGKMPKWISVEERLPKPETQVLILAKRGTYTVITNGMYEDGTLNTEDSIWHWYDHDFEYDEENDAYIIPAGWWEYKHYNGDDEYNHAIDDKVTHWMELPEGLKEG